jgi:hypothetical protein
MGALGDQRSQVGATLLALSTTLTTIPILAEFRHVPTSLLAI